MLDFMQGDYELGALGDDHSREEICEWVCEGRNVAYFYENKRPICSMVSYQNWQELSESAFPASPLMHWELRGLHYSDLPTLQQIFHAINPFVMASMIEEGYPQRCSTVQEEDEERLASGAVLRGIERLRHGGMVACDERPYVILPFTQFDACECEDGGYADVRLAAAAFELTDVMSANVKSPMTITAANAPEVLGYKIWLGGLRSHEVYLVLARIVKELLADTLTLPDMFMKAIPEEGEGLSLDAYIIGLRETAEKALISRMEDLTSRLRELDELVDVTFDVDEKTADKLDKIMRRQGLTLQQLMLIIITWFVENPELVAEEMECEAAAEAENR